MYRAVWDICFLWRVCEGKKSSMIVAVLLGNHFPREPYVKNIRVDDPPKVFLHFYRVGVWLVFCVCFVSVSWEEIT